MPTRPAVVSKRRLAAVALVIAACAACAAVPVASASRAHAAGSGCSTKNLVIWLDTQGNGAAGSIVYNVWFTNLGSACTLTGFPGVSAVNLRGKQLGNAALRNKAIPPKTIKLAHGGAAIGMVKITEAKNFPNSSCHETTAAGLKVFPPGAHRAKTIPFPFDACAAKGRHAPDYLNVRPVQKPPNA